MDFFNGRWTMDNGQLKEVLPAAKPLIENWKLNMDSIFN
jgi:hypothetical protein